IVLFKMCKPFNWFKSFMYITSIGICVACCVLLPTVFKYVALSTTDILYLIVVCETSYPIYVVGCKVADAFTKLPTS
ncbi:MAG: hypothetical protein MJ152_04105, partial [Clostridia bacterium]|nr:hypothetical protein [Clostridia bacterium]